MIADMCYIEISKHFSPFSWFILLFSPFRISVISLSISVILFCCSLANYLLSIMFRYLFVVLFVDVSIIVLFVIFIYLFIYLYIYIFNFVLGFLSLKM